MDTTTHPYGDIAFINDLDSETRHTMYALYCWVERAVETRNQFIEIWNMLESSYKSMVLYDNFLKTTNPIKRMGIGE